MRTRDHQMRGAKYQYAVDTSSRKEVEEKSLSGRVGWLVERTRMDGNGLNIGKHRRVLCGLFILASRRVDRDWDEIALGGDGAVEVATVRWARRDAARRDQSRWRWRCRCRGVEEACRGSRDSRVVSFFSASSRRHRGSETRDELERGVGGLGACDLADLLRCAGKRALGCLASRMRPSAAAAKLIRWLGPVPAT